MKNTKKRFNYKYCGGKKISSEEIQFMNYQRKMPKHVSNTVQYTVELEGGGGKKSNKIQKMF